MRKNNITINISYSVAETKDSINDAIAREIHEIETIDTARKAQRAKLCAFIKENRAALDVENIKATLKANGYTRQDVSRLLRSYGIEQKQQKKTAASMKIQAKAQSEFAEFRKRNAGLSKAELSAVIRRMGILARELK